MTTGQRLFVLGRWVTSIAFVGLGLCKLIQICFGISERDFMATPLGGVLIWTFSIAFVLGLLGIIPIALLLRQRTEPELQQPVVPRWVGWTLRVVLATLLLFISVIVIGVLLLGKK